MLLAKVLEKIRASCMVLVLSSRQSYSSIGKAYNMHELSLSEDSNSLTIVALDGFQLIVMTRVTGSMRSHTTARDEALRMFNVASYFAVSHAF